MVCPDDPEKRLVAGRRKYAKRRREEDPNILFRDLKGERAEPVETLVEGPSALVSEVDAAMGSVTFDREVDWRRDAPFLVGQSPLDIHHVEPDCLFGDV